MLIDRVLISVVLFSLWKGQVEAIPLLAIFFAIDIHSGANLMKVPQGDHELDRTALARSGRGCSSKGCSAKRRKGQHQKDAASQGQDRSRSLQRSSRPSRPARRSARAPATGSSNQKSSRARRRADVISPPIRRTSSCEM